MLGLVTTAGADDLLVVGELKQSYFQSFAGELSKTGKYRLQLLDAADPRTEQAFATAKAAITVGNEAARRAHPLGDKAVMVHAMMTEAMVDRLKASAECGVPHHAILLVEQPIERYLTTIQQALPERRRLGVLYGPQSVRHAQLMRALAAAHGFTLVEENIADAGELPAALTGLMPKIDVLLTLPDQVVVNADTARTLILDTYQHGVALVGYSSAMVKAGALMAIHSTPQQLGQQTLAVVRELTATGALAGSKEIHPLEFEVSVNYQVARVLGIELPEETLLRERAMRQEKKR